MWLSYGTELWYLEYSVRLADHFGIWFVAVACTYRKKINSKYKNAFFTLLLHSTVHGKIIGYKMKLQEANQRVQAELKLIR